MPICEIHCVKGLLQENELRRIIENLTTILLKAEGLEVNKTSKSLCYINVNESDSIFIAGEKSEYGKILLKIYVFSEVYTDSIKKHLHSDIKDLFIKENKYTMENNGTNIWSVIIPIEQNNFGVGGIPVSLDMTRKIVESTP